MNDLAQSLQNEILTVGLIQNRCLKEMTRKGYWMLMCRKSIVDMRLKKSNRNKATGLDGINPSLSNKLSKHLKYSP